MNNIIKELQSIWSTVLYYHYRSLYRKNPQLAADGLFKRVYHHPMNMHNPTHLIEKITWLELNTDTSLWTTCADKYRMREYVAQCGLQESLPKLYGHWADPNGIDFCQLPAEFVLKANNGCGTVKIVRNRDLLNERRVRQELKRWLRRPYGYMGAQKHYLSIKPCIIAEELLHQDEQQREFSPNSFVDYKVWCFNGEPESVLVVYERNSSGYSLDLYDKDWNRISEFLNQNGHFHYREKEIPQPPCLGEMFSMAKTLSAPFPEVRVDFYVVKGKPIIGELTFSTGYGYFTEEYYQYLGDKIDLLKTKRIY